MSHDAEKRAEDMIRKLRKVKGFEPMTPEEADTAFDESPAVPMSSDEIRSTVEYVLSKSDLGRVVRDTLWPILSEHCLTPTALEKVHEEFGDAGVMAAVRAIECSKEGAV